MTTAVQPAVAYRAVIDGAVGPQLDLERVAESVACAFVSGAQVAVRAMVTGTRERDLTVAEQERLVALAREVFA